MQKKVAVKAAVKQTRSSAKRRGAPSAQGAAAAKSGSKRGAPKAFQSRVVPLEPLVNRSKSFEKYGALARQMWVEQGLSSNEIEARLNRQVRGSTVLKWAKRHGWEAARQAKLQGPEALAEDVRMLFALLIQTARQNAQKSKRLPNEKFWDQLSKGAAAIERISGEAHFASHLTKFVDGLTKYCSANMPEILPDLTKALAGYTGTVLASR